MTSTKTQPPDAGAPATAPLNRALGQSERVQDKVERAGVGLGSVNAALKDEVAQGGPPQVEDALNKSEQIETEVQDAATELEAVNEALAIEVDERHHLESELARSQESLAESRQIAQRAEASAVHDSLTGLPNLALFTDTLRAAMVQAQRHAWRLAVMFIDLDGFKLVNDKHGHDVGDRILQLVGERLQGNVRGSDTVGRRSGDEFLLLMLEAKDEATAEAFAGKLLDALCLPYFVREERFAVGASIGVALYPEDGVSAAELLKNADSAMYAAKQRKLGVALFRAPVAGQGAAKS